MRISDWSSDVCSSDLLIGAGAKVRAYDPEGMQQAAPLLPGVCWCKNAYEAITGADAVAILTEWNEFRGLHMKRVNELMKAPVMIDLRNNYNPAGMRADGFSYRSHGRPQTAPDASSIDVARSPDPPAPPHLH